MKNGVSVIALLFVTHYAIGVRVPPGFECTGYVDIDECKGEPCDSDSTCINTIGGYNCKCTDPQKRRNSAGQCAVFCDNGNNGGCEGKKCTQGPNTVSCSCAAYPRAEENNLLARGKPVTMSSQYQCARGFCFPGSKAVDGIYAPPPGAHEYTSIAHTKYELNSYIQIDLQKNHCISAVKVWNRTPHAARLRNVLITIGETVSDVATTNTNAASVCAYHPGQPDNVERFDCPQRMYGRYVRVAKINYNHVFNLYEIEVIGF